MKNALIFVLLAALVGVSLWFWFDHNSLVTQLSVTRQDTNAASKGMTSLQLATCLSQAEVDYDQKWNGLCEQEGRPLYCSEFVGSPKDVQFSQIKNQQKTLCVTLYK